MAATPSSAVINNNSLKVGVVNDGENSPSLTTLSGFILCTWAYHFYLRMPGYMNLRPHAEAFELVLKNSAFLQSVFDHSARRIDCISRFIDERLQLPLLNRGALGNEFEEPFNG
ncbi:MAG: hypothetical protein JWL59_4882 [Chthoniobacteraceae bacterium]|nr:hypothetical protein [Chthoniobacteraceae bacterium]